MNKNFKLVQDMEFPVNSDEFLRLTQETVDIIKSNSIASLALGHIARGGETILKEHVLVTDQLTYRYAMSGVVIELSDENNKVHAKVLATPEAFDRDDFTHVDVWEFLLHVLGRVGGISNVYNIDGSFLQKFDLSDDSNWMECE